MKSLASYVRHADGFPLILTAELVPLHTV
jgi:hypothetical protein